MKALITLIFLGLVVEQITARDSRLSRNCLNGVTSRFKCCKGVPNAWYAHLKNPKDCGTFYQCDNGEPVLRECPKGLEWSVAADRCEHPKYARCSSNGSGSDEESGQSGELQPLLSEECYEGKLSAKECCKGISEWWVHLPDPEDCTKFYHCDNGKAVHKDCPDNLHWSVAANRCEWPYLAGCQDAQPTGYPTDTTQKPTESATKPIQTTEQPTEEPVVLPEGCYDGSISAEVCCVGVTAWWVHLPDPENCGKFYQCDNGQAVHKDCPAGLHWSITTDRCEWPDIAGCETPPSGPTDVPTDLPTSPEAPVLPGGCYDGSISAEVCCEGVTAWWVHLPDPENCGKFYQCDNGQAVHKDCPAGLHWSVTTDRCEWPDIAGCETLPSGPTGVPTDGPTSPETPVLPGGCYDGSISAEVCCVGVTAWWIHLPDPENCGKFYQCDNGQAVHKDCPAGLHWSVTTDRCEWPDIAGCETPPSGPTDVPTDGPTSPETPVLPGGCYDGSISAEVCCEGVTAWWIHLPDPENCGKFYQCDNGQAVHKDCPAGLHWSVTTDRCEWPDIAGCETPPSGPTDVPTDGPTSPETPVLPGGCYDGSISAEVCCEGVTAWWIHLPDPENCGKFYQCDNGQAVHKDCPAGLHWSVTTDRCEWPDIAGCETPPSGPTDVPTDGPTSPETPVLPGGCYDGSISAEVCCEGVTAWWIHLPDPENCGKFYQCDNGQAVHKDCPAGLHWSVTTDRCEWPDIAGCETLPSGPTDVPTDLPTSPETPVLPGGCYDGSISAEVCCEGVTAWWIHLPDPENCGKFYQCDNGQAVHKDCPAGLHWSVTTDRCEWPDIAGCETLPSGPTDVPTDLPTSPETPVLPGGCYDGSISAEVCCEGVTAWWVHLPDPENCGKFYQCDNGQAVHKDCPAGLHWSVTTDRCEWPDIAGCETLPSGPTDVPTDLPTSPETPVLPGGCYDGSISAEVCCEGVTAWWVHLPDPENCGKFYQCDNGQAVHKDCPAGLHWSVTTDRCEWPDIAGCETLPTTDVPTDEPTDGPEEDNCAPTPVCHHCYTGVFSAQLCCEGIKNWQKIHLAHPQDCTSYYDCINEAAILRKCPEGLHWSIITDRCEWPIHAQCSNSTGNGNENESEGGSEGEEGNNNGSVSEGCLYGEVDPNICCEDVPETVDVLLQNNSNCHTYYQCVHGKPKVRSCPASLWWSVKNYRCEWRRNATCTWETKY